MRWVRYLVLGSVSLIGWLIGCLVGGLKGCMGICRLSGWLVVDANLIWMNGFGNLVVWLVIICLCIEVVGCYVFGNVVDCPLVRLLYHYMCFECVWLLVD